MSSVIPNPQSATVEVFYGPHKLVPAPLLTYTVEPQFDGAGSRVGNKTRLVLDGSIILIPSGSYENLFIKQEWLRNTVFGTDNRDFLILAGAANLTLSSGTIISSGLRPRVISVDVEPDIHITKFDYSIELEDTTSVSGVSGITSSLSNQWSFREDPDSCTLQVTHTVSAEGPEGEPDKFLQAFRAVKALLGINNLPIDIPYFTEPNASGGFNFIHPSNPAGGPIFEVSVQREEVADVANGSYSATEIFQIVSGVPFFFSSRNESFQEDENGIATVTLQGTVQGLGRTITTGLGLDGGVGFQRAVSGFNNKIRPFLPSDASGIYVRYKPVLGASGLNVNNPTSFSVSQNACRGTVEFSVSYTDDPTKSLPSGIVSSTCSITRNDGIRLYASHPIPLRRLGNLLQDIKTTTEGSVSIQCQAQSKNTGNKTTDLNRAISYVQGELNRLRNVHANAANFVTLRLSSLDQQIGDTDLTCNATVVYAFTIDLAAVQSPTADITLRTV